MDKHCDELSPEYALELSASKWCSEIGFGGGSGATFWFQFPCPKWARKLKRKCPPAAFPKDYSRAPFQTRLSQKHSGLGSSLCLSVPPKCVGGRAWSAYAFSRNKTCNTFLATKATKLPTGPARATVEKKTFSCPKIQIAAVRAFQYGSVNGCWISWPHTAQHRPRGGKSHTSLLFCGHLDVSTYPIVWQTFYPASYLQKRNSGVTLLFSEKVPRIAGLFWARFWYTWFETFLAYGSTRSPPLLCLFPLLCPPLPAAQSIESVWQAAGAPGGRTHCSPATHTLVHENMD
jgi:hypothetical protein